MQPEQNTVKQSLLHDQNLLACHLMVRQVQQVKLNAVLGCSACFTPAGSCLGFRASTTSSVVSYAAKELPPEADQHCFSLVFVDKQFRDAMLFTPDSDLAAV